MGILLASGSVAADPAILARHDIVDVRAGREPTRVHVLGWANDGSVYVRTALCEVGDASGLMHCRIAVDRIAVDGTRQTTVLFDHTADDYCDLDHDPKPCGQVVIPYAAASKLIAAETAFMSALPPLALGTEVADGAHALGPDVVLEMMATPVDDLDVEAMNVSLVAKHGSRRATLVAHRRGDSRIEVGPTFRAWISPDETTAVVAVRYGTGVMCWGPFTNIDVHRIDIAEARAKI